MQNNEALRQGSDKDALSIQDVLTFVWAHRIAMAIGLFIGLLLAYPATFLVPDSISRKADISIYPTGTPIDTAAAIQFQLQSVLADKGIPTKAVAGGGLTVLMSYDPSDANAGQDRLVRLSRMIDDFETSLLARVNDAYTAFKQGDQSGQGNEAIDLSFRSFQSGIEARSIDLIRVVVSETDRRGRRQVAAVLVMITLGAASGLLIGAICGRLLR